ncbi:Zn-ribbon domain-containing OB-fold protein, partial [Gordonia terrae]
MTQTTSDPGAVARSADGTVPVVSYLRLGDEPAITGHRCPTCAAVYVLRRSTCASCGSGDLGARADLASTGVVDVATRVHRAAPGIETPFLSGVVKLDGGGFVRAT